MVDEVYDVVDKEGNKIATATWTEVHTQGLLHQTAGILIFKDKTRRETLVHQRSKQMGQLPGIWQLAAGGHILTDQTPDEAIKMELAEELFDAHDLPELPIKKIGSFYNHDIPGNYEIYHLYEGIYPGPFYFSKAEIAGPPVWVSWDQLLIELKSDPTKYAQFTHNAINYYILKNKQA